MENTNQVGVPSIPELTKRVRINLDGLTKDTQNLTKSREISLAITKLQECKMWLGRALKEYGIANPYPESRNPENEKIEPTADAATQDRESPFDGYSHIPKVKWLRDKIQNQEYEIISLWKNRIDRGYEMLDLAFENSYTNIVDAQLWLGMELGAIRDKQEATEAKVS